MFFSNYKKIATSSVRKDLLRLAIEGIKSVLPNQIMSERVKLSGDFLLIDQQPFLIKNRRIFVLGAGKASAAMAEELEKILSGENITHGIVISNDRLAKSKRIEIHYADHPIPSEKSVDGAKKLIELKAKYKINKEDLIIFLLSGGGSSLMSYPVEGISLEDKRKLTEILIKSGANVHEMTILKKKISGIKGGKLARYFYPTQIVVKIISDVVGNDLDVIASGPFTKDKSGFNDALDIINKYQIKEKIPPSVLSYLKANKGNFNDSEDFSHVNQFILADNDSVLNKVKSLAEKQNIKVVIRNKIQGETRQVANRICSNIFRQSYKKPTLFLYGGETTVTLDKSFGRGGRNQEFVLACLNFLKDKNIGGEWVVASVATDGMDFIKESTGAIIDNQTFDLVRKRGIDVQKFLDNHDAYNLLSKINSNIEPIGPTGTNVCDFMMFLFK